MNASSRLPPAGRLPTKKAASRLAALLIVSKKVPQEQQTQGQTSKRAPEIKQFLGVKPASEGVRFRDTESHERDVPQASIPFPAG